MRIPRRLALLAAGASVVLGASVVTAEAAHAGTGNEWCLTSVNTKCINAWGGGPFVKLYTGQGGGSNSDFTVVSAGSGNVVLRFTGNSSWADGKHCIGDAFNDPNHLDTSLDVCDTATGDYGWGTLFTSGGSGCPIGFSWFHDNHGNGYLGPADSNTNGSPFYLNKPSKYCYLSTSPE